MRHALRHLRPKWRWSGRSWTGRYVLLSDVFQNTSYVPWRRHWVKVNKEESFHINFGVEPPSARLGPDEAETQRAIDWMFPLTWNGSGCPTTSRPMTGNCPTS